MKIFEPTNKTNFTAERTPDEPTLKSLPFENQQDTPTPQTPSNPTSVQAFPNVVSAVQVEPKAMSKSNVQFTAESRREKKCGDSLNAQIMEFPLREGPRQQSHPSLRTLRQNLPELCRSGISELICFQLAREDVFTITDEISRFVLGDIKVGNMLDVNIGEIYDLSKFWMYMTCGGLDKLMKDMQSFFATNHSFYVIPQTSLQEGLYCIAFFSGSYHRCVIVNMLKSKPNLVRLLYVDYGTVQNVNIAEIWFLPKKFGELPRQSVRARLSNMYPLYENCPWSGLAVTKFRELVTNRVVVAEVTKIDIKDHVLEVYLADKTHEDNIFYINDIFIEKGYAVCTNQERKTGLVTSNFVPAVKCMQLYPEFDEIEAGLVPTFEEMQHFFKKIPSHINMSQFFDISHNEDILSIQLEHQQLNQSGNNVVSRETVEDPDFDSDFSTKPGSGTLISLEESPDSVPFMNSFEHNNLNENNAILPSNPFFSDLLLSVNTTNKHELVPLMNNFEPINLNNNAILSTNPFLYDLSSDNTTNKPSNDNLPQKSNNLNVTKTGDCKRPKQVNMGKAVTGNLPDILEIASGLNVSVAESINAMTTREISTSEQRPRIRAPHGMNVNAPVFIPRNIPDASRFSCMRSFSFWNHSC